MDDDELVDRLREQGRTAPGVEVSRERVWQAARRRRQHRLAGATAGTVAAVAAVAIGIGSTGGLPGTPQPMAAGVEFRGTSYAVEQGDLTALDVAAAQTAFGLDLLHAVCAEQPGENLLLSPTSAAQALGLVQPAAGGETARAFADLLHLPDWSPELVAALQEYTAAIDALAAEDGPAEADRVRMSNRVWLQEGVRPTQEYLDGVATAYDAGLEALDFMSDPAGATDRINDAVGEDTAGLIPTLFAEPLGTGTRVVLTNAVHLKAQWAMSFDDAVPAPFAAPDGEVTADLMHGGSGTVRVLGEWWTDDDVWTSVEIPYEDGTLAAVAVLPPEGTNPCATDAATLEELAGVDGWESDVSLPRMRLEQTHSLLDVLIGLGMPRAGDFDGFGAGENLAIVDVVQKTVMEIDEQGTEAAAATGVVMAESAASMPLVLDRPFLLLLTDTETRSPLFMAVIQNPTAG